MQFNIITEPWIPVLYFDNSSRIVSLRDTFKDAHQIIKINDDNEMVNLGILRLLIAFFMDAYKMKHKVDRLNAYNEPFFDMNTINLYISECEKNGDVFNLFDKDTPFLQTADMDDQKISPVSRISDFKCSGEDTTFFGGLNENQYVLTPEECIRDLCQKMTTFFKMQGEGYQNLNYIENAIFMLNKGKNLKETIILNSISKGEWEQNHCLVYFHYGTEKSCKGPAWKQGKILDQQKNKINLELSLLSLMTFLPVNIQLVADNDGLIRRVKYTSKHFKDKDSDPITLFQDPMTIIKNEIKNECIINTKPAMMNQNIGFWEIMDCLNMHKYSEYYNIPLVMEKEIIPMSEIEVWSACRDGKAKGILFHDSFEITDSFFDMDVDELQKDADSFSNIINTFRKSGIATKLKGISETYFQDYLNDIIREFNSFMNYSYMNDYVKYVSKLKNRKEKILYKKEYRKRIVNSFENIAIDYIHKFNHGYKRLKIQNECEIIIRKYFKQWEEV